MKEEWNGEDRRALQPERWHIKREFQVGHFLTTIVIAASVFAYVSSMEKRIALLEQSVQAQHERDERQDKAVAEILASIEKRLGRLDDKLDKVLYQQPIRR